MGTSASGTGPRPITPLIPSWISGDDFFPIIPNHNDDVDPDDDANQENNDTTDDENNLPDFHIPVKRYNESRSEITKYVNNRDNERRLRKSLRSYVRKANGGASNLATRVAPSIKRVSIFYTVINTIKDQGLGDTLLSFNLQEYNGRPLLDVMAALMDIIFDKSHSTYSDIQDDSITKLAYANTINRIIEIEELDLNTLTSDQIAVMTSIFIEETIATRVICEVGIKLFERLKYANEIIQVEETIYQVVSGLVRNDIMPEILNTQVGNSENIERNIRRIYQIAFNCIAEN